MDLTTAHPSEIDLALAEIYGREHDALRVLDRHAADMHYAADHRRVYGDRNVKWSGTFEDALAKVKALAEGDDYRAREAANRYARYTEAAEAVAAIRREARPLNAEFQRRGGWTRAFLAKSANGHVHNGMDCSTCHHGVEDTEFAWFPQYSGKPEAEIVEDAGERACTTCYPSAPVSVLSRPTKFFSDEEKAAAAAREERAAKKAERDALKVIVPDFPTRKIRPSRIEPAVKEFKTLRAATQAAVDARYDVLRYSTWASVPEFGQQALPTAQAVERAIAEKTGTPLAEVTADIEKRAAAKAKRNGL